LEKKFKLCPHGRLFIECPLCKEDTSVIKEKTRIETLLKQYNEKNKT